MLLLRRVVVHPARLVDVDPYLEACKPDSAQGWGWGWGRASGESPSAVPMGRAVCIARRMALQ